MPIYEYRCTGCRHTLEKIQKVSEAPLKRCPRCGGNLEKLFSVAAVQFKGGGWYSDGYSGKSKPPADAGSEGKADKPETSGVKEPKKAAAGGCGSGSCGCA